ncbi:tetratricopeptide repeat-containing sulfotransferase family protein [Rhodanobacter hydrolyticus]|uniref:Sulfotransferase n=1 Tax=Rhodanobacter hydrolyticus TaxID=2250595 RepID=A0ABW8J6A2_9GAMM
MIDSTRAYSKLVAAFNQNDWPRVQQRVTQLLAVTQNDASVHFMAGVACMCMHQMPRALEHLLKATHLEPRRVEYVAQYACALSLTRRFREARLVADRAMTLSPNDVQTLGTLGTVYKQANAHVQSANAFRRAVALAPEQAIHHLNLAYALNSLGDAEGAEQELETCVRLEPRHWYAHLLLAQLRKQTTEHNHVERLHELLQRHGHDPGADLLLNVALGKEYDDLGDYPPAFEHYSRGKAAGRRIRPYAFTRDEAMFEALHRAFPSADAEPTMAGDPTNEPIFIIGMPRTGTTLLDRVLSSHPEVRSAGELQNFPTLLQRASGCPTALLSEADIAARTRHIDWRQLGAAYLASTRPVSGETPRFIDKMPHNFLYAGFIARALPNAKIVCLRRDPLDTCIGNFRHLFDQESGFYDYSFNLDDIGRYYIQFDRLMAHWRKLFPGRIHEVQYEALVENTEATTRELLEFCKLPWDDACLRSEDNATPVSTPNAWQVRAPIYGRAIGHWRHYEPQLRDLRWRLASAGIGTAG